MVGRTPFVLLDDARADGAADAHYYENPRAVFAAHSPDRVAGALAEAEAMQRAQGGTLAGFIAYEAGLALEPRLAGLAAARTGAAGPLVWLGLFDDEQVIPAADMAEWLAQMAPDDGALGPLNPQLSRGAYQAAFDRLQDAIRAGDIYQANLTFPLAGSYRGDELALYRQLRPAAQAGYGGVVFDGAGWLLSQSPELFVARHGQALKAKPMKGTRPRGADAAADRALARELAASEKDRAENLMIVDLLRNDLSRVAQAGSVEVDAPFTVESYPTVHQMVSTVRATLHSGTSTLDLVRAIFPCGSITGAPKIRAMELIAATERDARGAYCGAIGRIGVGGDAAFNVAIRTLRLTPVENGHGTAVLGVGSAIVADSDADTEWRECVVKGGFARNTSPQHTAPVCDLIETMLFDPDSGIALLEHHLGRIKASAAELGFAFDHHGARNQIQALCFELDRPARLRLLVSRRGAIALEASDLPPSLPDPALCIALPLPVDPGDWRLRHKTSDRQFYADALALAQTDGAHEALLVDGEGRVTEGSYTNVFVEREGVLLTPPAALGLLPGVLRGSLIEQGRAREAELTLADLENGFLIGNALRGLIKAKLVP